MLWLLAILPVAASPIAWWCGPSRRARLAGFATAVLGLVLLFAAYAVIADLSGSFAVGPMLSLSVGLDRAAGVMVLLVPAVALPIVLYAAFHEDRSGLARLIALLLFFVGAMELLVIAADFVTLLVGWELVGACSWALIAHEWREEERPQAATRAFLVTRAGDLGLFFAAMALFSATGSFRFADLGHVDSATLSLVAAGVCVAALAKSAQFPFSPWLFAAMAGPTSASALLHSATMVAAGVYLLATLQPAFASIAWFAPVILAVGAVTAVVAGAVALAQGHAKKLLAASTSAQFGLMAVAIGAGFPMVAMLHLAAHAFVKALLFAVAGVAGEARGTMRLAELRVGSAFPKTAMLSAVAAAALAGIPLLGMAWTKERIVAAAGDVALPVLSSVFVASALSAAYAVRFQLLAFGRSPRPVVRGPANAEGVAVAMLGFAVLVFSALWWPGAEAAITSVWSVQPPESTAAEMWLSWICMAGGVAIGVISAAKLPQSRAVRFAGAWFGVSNIAVAAIEAPFHRLSRLTARFDDAVPSAVPRAVADRAVELAGRLEDAVPSAAPRGIADRAVVVAVRLSRFDGDVVRAAILRLVAGSCRGAGFAVRIDDDRIAGAVRVLASRVDDAGRNVRWLQGGQTHRYYAWMTTATAALLLALWWGM